MMSEAREDLLLISGEAVRLQKNGDLPQSVATLSLLQGRLIDIDRWQLDPSVLWNLCEIIQREAGKWTGEMRPCVDNLRVVSGAFCCLRNTMPNCSRNQLIVAENDDLLKPMISCILWTFGEQEQSHVLDDDHLHPSDQEAAEGDMRGEGAGWREAHTILASSTLTCLGNLVAANSKTRRIVWPHFRRLLKSILVFPDKEVAHISTMILHNCLLEEEIKEEICNSTVTEETHCSGKQVLKELLSLYETETKYSCFVLLSLEVVLASEELLARVWPSLSGSHQMLCLDVMEAGLTHSGQPLCGPQGEPSLNYLVGLFKDEADSILRTHADWLNPESAQVLAKLGNFVCVIAASDTWRPILQQDQSILVTSLELLHCITDIGKMGDNAFTPLDRLSDMNNQEQMTQAVQHPAFGFKCDLIRLVASLTYLSKNNQDKVREMGGLLLILESSKFDARNPLIKETSIFALRNLLEGNLENQHCVRELRMEGVASSPSLAELGMTAVQDGERVRLMQQPRSPSPEL